MFDIGHVTNISVAYPLFIKKASRLGSGTGYIFLDLESLSILIIFVFVFFPLFLFVKL